MTTLSAALSAPPSSAPVLPVVDISRFRAGGAERVAFLADFRAVLHDYGFFYLAGHGVDPALVAETVAAAKRFFRLPAAEKEAIAMVQSPHFRGYTGPGLEYTRGAQDWREQLDVNSEREAIAPGPDTPPWTRLIGPNQWPAAQPDLKPVLLAYQAEVTRVGIEVVRAVAAALVGDADALANLYDSGPNQLLKIIRYPGREVAQSSQGVGAHKDGGLVTVLLQDVVAGLRVQSPEGTWLDVPPLPGTFVINTGEILELLTDGYIRAAVHDVVAPPAGVERFSVAFFLGAALDATIGELNLPAELAAGRRGVTQDRLNPLFRDVGRNALKGRLRSHPDVARRHHADLLSEEELRGEARASAY